MSNQKYGERMIIRATQKLQKEMGLKPADLVDVEESAEPFVEWYAHVFLLERRKQVVFVERHTLFSFTLEDVARKDLRTRLPELFEKGLGEALYVEGASAEVISQVLAVCRDDVQYAKASNRRTIGAMNEFVKHHKFSYSYHGKERIKRDRHGRFIPMKSFAHLSKEYDWPLDVFARVVKERFALDFVPQKEEHIHDAFQNSQPFLGRRERATGNVYTFGVVLGLIDEEGHREKIMREIAVSGNKPLSHLAEVILLAYQFECDHCYGFYSDLVPRRGVAPDEVYELFADLGNCEPTYPHALGVEKTEIRQAFSIVGKKMRFLFDYGDDWNFFITLTDIRDPQPAEMVPAVLRSIGEAPEQYPRWDEE